VVLSTNTIHPFDHTPALPLAATVTRESEPRLTASDRAKLSDTCNAEAAAEARFDAIKLLNEGAAKLAKMATMATVTINSISENPEALASHTGVIGTVLLVVAASI
jgi:hypothetical protein